MFDIDDTVFLERDYVRSGFRAASRWIDQEHGISRFGEVAWELFENGRRSDVFDEALRRLGVMPGRELVQRLVREYRCHTPEIELFPDARGCLAALRSEGVPIAAITDGPPESQRAKVQALGLGEALRPAIYTSELGAGHGKPDTLAFEIIQAIYPSHLCCYVADNPLKDFVPPRRLGWKSVRIRRPGGLHFATENQPGSYPDYEIDQLTGLAELLLVGAAQPPEDD